MCSSTILYICSDTFLQPKKQQHNKSMQIFILRKKIEQKHTEKPAQAIGYLFFK